MGTDSDTKTEKPKISLLKQAALQIVAGGSAGFVEVCIMHPLDLVKTRLQIQNKTSAGQSMSSPSNQVCIDFVPSIRRPSQTVRFTHISVFVDKRIEVMLCEYYRTINK